MNEQHENPNSEEAWGYIHGALGADACKAFEERMSRDGALRAFVEEVRTTDRQLRQLAPSAALTEIALEDRLMAAWDAAQANVQGRSATPGVENRRFQFMTFKPVRIALALAACSVAVMFGVRQMQPAAITWDVEIVQMSQYRGSNGEASEPRYTRAEMTSLVSSLRESVEFQYREVAAREKGAWLGWVLSTRIQELESGRLAIQVQAFKGKGQQTPVKEWLKNYSDAKAFRLRITEYGQQIVQDLVVL